MKLILRKRDKLKIRHYDQILRENELYKKKIRSLSAENKNLRGLFRNLSSKIFKNIIFSSSIQKMLNMTESSFSTINELSQEAKVSMNEMTQFANQIADATAEVSGQLDNASELFLNLTHLIANQNTILRKASDELDAAERSYQNLYHTSGKINDVITMINEINDRTNLLSLNASIEAARAGTAGRGFSVVAEEIQKLSTQTVNATREIEEWVKGLVEALKHFSEDNRQLSESFRKALDSTLGVEEKTELSKAGMDSAHSLLQTIASTLEEQTASIVHLTEYISHMQKQVNFNSSVVSAFDSNVDKLSDLIV